MRYGFDAMSDEMRLFPRGNENRTRNLNMGFCDDSCDDKDIDERSKENERVLGCGLWGKQVTAYPKSDSPQLSDLLGVVTTNFIAFQRP